MLMPNLSRTDAEQQVVNVVHKENDGANAMVIPTSNIQQTKTKAKSELWMMLVSRLCDI